MENGMNKSKLIAILFAFVLISTPAFAGEEDAILGKWWNKEKDAQVDVHKCGAKICGKIVWLKEPTYPADSKEGTPGSPKIDVHNKDESLRTRPILGLVFLTGFSYEGEQIWTGGRVYDPKGGKTYDGRLTLRNADTLDLKGGYKVGFMMIGKESTWTRVK
ncbi:PF09917 family protein [Leptospira interrogans serovar Icterohaemorrhagiae str. Verdun HP]|uniref:PF09917 family protein n=1 Tax=Leptospira interrogans serovar Icterohaemorrhagiae str. Verdun HP TaxID=1049910 RepID=M6RUQ3_LEPIR|nr:PF09917 family protein [Leptospira interrogans serovar Icterohaemorrhagiae str. Verdun HP]